MSRPRKSKLLRFGSANVSQTLCEKCGTDLPKQGRYICAVFEGNKKDVGDERHEHYHYRCLPDELKVAWAFDIVPKLLKYPYP